MVLLFGNLESGNVHKVQLLLRRLGMRYHRVDVSQSAGQTRHSEFLRLNPIGKVPVLRFDSGDVLTESNAILFYLAQSTELWPAVVRQQAEVLRWMFFEQYSHEPYLAVLRYRRRWGDGQGPLELLRGSERALSVLEERLSRQPWLASEQCTVADYALYPYTRWAPEAGLDLLPYPSVRQWLSRIEALPNFLALRSEGADAVVPFAEYLAAL